MRDIENGCTYTIMFAKKTIYGKLNPVNNKFEVSRITDIDESIEYPTGEEVNIDIGATKTAYFVDSSCLEVYYFDNVFESFEIEIKSVFEGDQKIYDAKNGSTI
ncbi:MAG: hypothetical protein R2883_00025 [Caldisericia bacterium]